MQIGNYVEALKYLEEAVKSSRKVREEEQIDMVMIYNNIAVVYKGLGRR